MIKAVVSPTPGMLTRISKRALRAASAASIVRRAASTEAIWRSEELLRGTIGEPIRLEIVPRAAYGMQSPDERT